MDKTQEILHLFRDFQCADPKVKGEATGFSCHNQEACRVQQDEEAIWSPSLGSPDTIVMIVAEAPSTSGGMGPRKGRGPHVGGIADRENFVNQNLLRFVERYYKCIPHFTDLMKCGIAKQNREQKRIFEIRKRNCVERYLRDEIRIIDPKVILCIGAMAYTAVVELKEKGAIAPEQIVKLVHYSRQASLPLSAADKENVVWPFQAGMVPVEDLANLSFFEKGSTP